MGISDCVQAMAAEYLASPKGQEMIRSYLSSPEGKAMIDTYLATPEGQQMARLLLTRALDSLDLPYDLKEAICISLEGKV
jgi:hypothetical protein